MNIGDRVLGYRLITNATVSSGRCTWAFAEKNGNMYFVKQFLSPKYPIDGTPGSVTHRNAALKRCELFEASQRRILEAIRHKVASGGSLVAPVGFGRVGTTYYKIYDRIDVTNLTPSEIAGLASDRKLLIMRVVAHSLSILHRGRIVHGDLKPANILIKTSATGVYTSKLIDFDDSYFEGEPPEDAELVVGDPAYYSPELLEYVITNDPKKRSKITTKSDIFAMGLIFTEYWTGDFPTYDKTKFGCCAAAVLGAEELRIDGSTIEADVARLIRRMVQRDANERPVAAEVLSVLKSVGHGETESKSTEARDKGSSRLLGKRSIGDSAKERVGRPAESTTKASETPPGPSSSASRVLWKGKP